MWTNQVITNWIQLTLGRMTCLLTVKKEKQGFFKCVSQSVIVNAHGFLKKVFLHCWFIEYTGIFTCTVDMCYVLNWNIQVLWTCSGSSLSNWLLFDVALFSYCFLLRLYTAGVCRLTSSKKQRWTKRKRSVLNKEQENTELPMNKTWQLCCNNKTFKHFWNRANSFYCWFLNLFCW